jgi:Bacterial SH3 domain
MKRTVLLLAAALAAGVAQAAPATLVRAVELKQQPASDAPSVAQLAADAAVDAGERRGGWVRVKTAAGESGWVKLLSLRYARSGDAKSGDSGVAQLFNVARSGSSGTRVATGVRGLDAEQLANAQPNLQALRQLEDYAVDGAAAQKISPPAPG